jgi:hypothetical protein
MIETFDDTVPRAEVIERRRQALLPDLFLTGANAVTQTGALMNLGMVGNRVAALTFGPKWVVVVAGCNKIVPRRGVGHGERQGVRSPGERHAAHEVQAPLRRDLPLARTAGVPTASATPGALPMKSFPPGRTKVVLIARDLGL